MAELPLLLFPSPEVASRTLRNGSGGNLRRPTAAMQSQRLNPIFQQLQESFNDRSVELQQTPAGIDPEQVLVIETVGNVEDFAKAVNKIKGLEWMGELITGNISPDESFQDKKDPEKELSGRLYLMMSNQAALTQMLSLWQKSDETNFRSGKYRGLAKFKEVFLHLKDIRKWGIEDRLVEREVFEKWQEDLEFDAKRSVRFEAELWYRRSDDKRRKSESIVRELIQKLGGNMVSQCVIPSIAYHSVLGEIPAQAAIQIVKQPEVDLIKCEDIMFFRPTGQISTGKGKFEGDVTDCKIPIDNLPSGAPVVAVLDGLPLENHSILAGRLIVDDPDDWALEYPAIDRQHGTAIVSLIVHGDINDYTKPLSRPVYVRPIMKPMAWPQTPRLEKVPDDILYVDLIHRAVRRIIEGEGNEEGSAPTVRIINISVGDSARHFSQAMSPFARLLDWLSEKYKLLFIISSGNHSEPIDIGMSSNDFSSLSPHDREALVVNKIYKNARHRRLLSPAESINGLTIGALHHDNSQNILVEHFINVFESTLPSPISAFGSGYGRAVKPDFLCAGGRVLYSQSIGSRNIKLELSNRRIAPGNQVAAPSTQIGELNKSQFCCGSSNSAALTSRAASICYDYLVSIFAEHNLGNSFAKFLIPILKAMLVHGCAWNELGGKLGELLIANDKGTNKKKGWKKDWISRWAGYGAPDFDKVLGCNQQRATLIGFGELDDGNAHVYKLPLPPSLSAQREWRRLTVTLAWLSPVASTTQRYRVAQLWFDFEGGGKSRKKLKNKLSVSGIDTDSNATRRGTVQHEIFEGEDAIAITDGDSLSIKVNCREDAQKIELPVAYGLVVSLEVSEGINLPIYNEVSNRIMPSVEIRAR